MKNYVKTKNIERDYSLPRLHSGMGVVDVQYKDLDYCQFKK